MKRSLWLLTLVCAGAIAASAQPVPPRFTLQPTNVVTVASNEVRFSVETTGQAPIAYQWRFSPASPPPSPAHPNPCPGCPRYDWRPVAHGTDATLVVTNVTAQNAGFYQVTASNTAGGTLSSQARLTVLLPAHSVSFGNQWRYFDDGTEPSGPWREAVFNDANWSVAPGPFTNGTTLPLPGGTPLKNTANTCYFRTHFTLDQITNGIALEIATVLDDGVVLYINGEEVKRMRMPAGAITHATPANAEVEKPVLETFTVGSSQLRVGDNVLAAELHQANPSGDDAAFALQLNALIPAGNDSRPVIYVQPKDLTVLEGSTNRLRVAAGGTGPLFYQWQFEGANVRGATNASLLVTNSVAQRAGVYQVIVSNHVGGVQSRTATLDWLAPLAGRIEPGRTNVDPAKAFLLIVAPAQPADTTYLWRHNGRVVPGKTRAEFRIERAKKDDSGLYEVVISNRSGILLTAPALVSVGKKAPRQADSFADSVKLKDGDEPVWGDTTSATAEAGEPAHAGQPAAHSVWYTWTAPNDPGVVTFDTAGSAFDTVLGIYTNASSQDLEEVASDDQGDPSGNSRVAFNAIPRQEYHIAVDGFSGATGEFALSWTWEASTDLLPEFEKDGHPVSRTVPTDQTCEFVVKPRGGGMLQWFHNGQPIANQTAPTLTIPKVQRADVGHYWARVTNRSGRHRDSRHAILEIGSNDLIQTTDRFAPMRLRETAEVIKHVVPLTRPGSRRGPSPMQQLPRPRGGKMMMMSGPNSVAAGHLYAQLFSTYASSTQSGEPVHCDIVGEQSRWLILRPACPGLLDVNTQGSAAPTVLAVYTGDDIFNLSRVACDAGGTDSHVRLPVAKDTNYIIVAARPYGSPPTPATAQLNWQLMIPLAITRSVSSISIQWPDPATNFVLQSVVQLPTNPNTPWPEVANVPILQNGTNTVTLPNNGNAFFRLKRP